MSPNDVLSVITEHYLSSYDFNGISAEQLAQTFGVAWPTLYDPLHRLISEGKVGALFVETDVNPHIIRIGFEPEETQLVQLATCHPYHTCFYPRPTYLELVVDQMRYASEPYRLCLALGEAPTGLPCVRSRPWARLFCRENGSVPV